MKLASCFLLLKVLIFYKSVFSRPKTWMVSSVTYDPTVVKNILKIIENRMIAQGSQNFECVFYDISNKNPFDVVLDDLLRSPRLKNVVKYVVQGIMKADHQRYPRKPSLLLVYTGTDEEFNVNRAYLWSANFLVHISTTTTVIVIVELLSEASYLVFQCLAEFRFIRVIYMDTISGYIMLASENTHTYKNFVIENSGAIEKWHQRALRNRDIIYVLDYHSIDTLIDLEWINATAKYLNVSLAEYNPKRMKMYDIDLAERLIFKYIGRFERIIFQTALGSCKIFVPKENPLSTIEIMIMPFNWTVWTLLFFILAATEFANHFLPDLFRNDPILYVVCGFERHDLHKAALQEKMILISLVIMMFFMSNAFETKVISLMIKRPSPQHIKSLADFDKYGLKFHYNLSNNPRMVDHPVIGKYVVHSNETLINFYKPNGAYHVKGTYVRIMKRFPTLVVLDEEYFEGVVGYKLENRSTFGEILQYTYSALGEAGLWDLWRLQWEDRTYGKHISYEKVILTFDDFLPAWLVLGIGWCVGCAGFLGELLTMLLRIHRQMICSKAVKIWNCFWKSDKKLRVKKLKN